MVLKAEIHCHIEGAAFPDLVETQGRKYGVDITPAVRDGAYVWHDFTSFLAAYDLAASLFRVREDYALLARTYLTSLAEDGAIYSEFFISTDHAVSAGLDPADYVAGIAEGMEQAKAATGIEARMIATGLRHMGPQAVERAARWIATNPHPLVTGFGMAGDERMHHPRDFAGAFDLAREAGLGITVHAGELLGPESVRDALDHLKPSRIGHGVRAIEDPALVERLAEEGIVLEVCPGSNISLEVFPDFASHPFSRLHRAGCKVTLSSDDPPHFHTSLAREYQIARDEFGYGDSDLLGFTRTAIEAAFLDGDSKARLLEKLGPG
ncbi:MAG: adenosine deaminase [Nitratireductor sp.]